MAIKENKVIVVSSLNNQTMMLEGEVKKVEDFKFKALYKFAVENGVDIKKFMEYLSNYSWNNIGGR
ncbi:hypothetical protein PFDSM3638_05575 [Pyrococcus furiosus DSM 3638]|uniref:Uncharacterized protein n=2 Tax=Pyrococcus furiosus TaxID=2261 RepID=A0A5C0XP47_PYRFU|nr:hypothetical protein PFC_04785 [Pyrococcus furiosus COM1]MDK2868766.1 hypothetical protein [Pyrococcus sp.]QEK78767.1 hypothetical protein PFDSM3638_05575 [Pyrococcus furiosus DSM 3638]